MHCVSHRTVSPDPWLSCARHPNHANHESSAYCILHQVVSPMIASAVMHLVYLLPENYASEIVQLRMRRQPVVGLACLPHACLLCTDAILLSWDLCIPIIGAAAVLGLRFTL